MEFLAVYCKCEGYQIMLTCSVIICTLSSV